MKITLYRRLPESIQRITRHGYSLVPISIRMGKTYRDTKRFLKTAESWSKEEIQRWQSERLRRIIDHAFNTTRGYRQLYDEAGVSPKDFRFPEDIHTFPFVTKELIRDNLNDFVSSAVPQWKRLYRATGGSTGIPFGFFLVQEDIERELAFLHGAWERAGWKLGDVSAVLRGAFIGNETNLWRYDPFLKDLLLSTYYLSGSTYDQYSRRIMKARPKHLQAYPSAAEILADLVLERNDSGKIKFDLLLLGSENLFDWQKEKILKAFPGSRIFSWYGHAEQVLFAPMCESSGSFHLDPFYGIHEILSEENVEVAEGENGELVGTSLWNTTTPFIRYRTMDMARKGKERCDSCGRNYQLLSSIEGRLQELIVTKDGRYISMTAMNMHSNVFDNVKQFQFHQKEAGKVSFRIVRKREYTEEDSLRIRSELMKKLGSDIELEITFADSIEKPQSGKFRFLIQELPISYGKNGRP